jgi:hypothetical protein
MWIFEQLLGRGIEVALLRAADREDRADSDATTTTAAPAAAPTAALTAAREER